MSNFSYNVVAIKEITPEIKGFVFQPDLLEIIVDGRQVIDVEGQATEIIYLRTVLTQHMEDRKIVEFRNHQFPAAMLQNLVSGVDVVTPIVNPVALNQFLYSFNLKLIDNAGK